MPPTERLKGLISHMMTEQLDKDHQLTTMRMQSVSFSVYLREELHEPGYAAKVMKAYTGTQAEARL